MAWNADLDPESVAYKVAAATEARVRVIAGPGTGKSSAMKRRVARLLEIGTAPDKILAVTFTRVAADDLHRELQKLNVPGCEELKGQTLHSLAMGVLSRAHVLQALGRHARPLNRFETKALVADLADTCGGRNACKKLIKEYEAAWAQTQGDDPGFAKTKEEQAFEQALVSWLKFHEAMLIGEVVPYLVRYLKHNPGAPEHSEYEHLLIDEYQDLNKAEQTALAYLGEKAAVCVVGDDDQSIYSFKSAHPDGIRQWKNVHAGCADMEMSDCHRCPTDVVAMANHLIAQNTNRTERSLTPIAAKGKGQVQIVQLKNHDAEASWIAKKIAELLAAGTEPGDIIVLAQREYVANAVLAALKAAAVPAKSYYEESQLNSAFAQERFSQLKLLLDEEDRVALRYLLGAGAESFRAPAYARLRAYCEQSGLSPWQTLEGLAAGQIQIKHAGSLVAEFVKIKDQLDGLKAAGEDVAVLIDLLFPEGNGDLADVRELAIAVAASEDTKTPRDLFAGMMEEFTAPDVPPSVDEVRVMSLHKSKGLSSPYVFVAGCIQGIIPQMPSAATPKAAADAALEEARRLFFVAITRVKADPAAGKPGSLFLTHHRELGVGKAAASKISFTKVVYGKAQLQPSVFLHELGPAAPKSTAA